MQKNNFSLADIHTHILPGIDDGADSVEVAIELLYEEQKQGISPAFLLSPVAMKGRSLYNKYTLY